MADQTALLQAFADYAQTISGEYDIGDVLYRLTDHVVEVLDVDGAGVSLDDDGQLRFVTATDDRVVAVEHQQVDVADGPATRRRPPATGSPAPTSPPRTAGRASARSPSDRDAAPWPASPCAPATRPSARSTCTATPPASGADELEVAQVLADMASGYIVNARTLSATRELAEQLQTALNSRIIIEQANGILAERRSETPAVSFNAMRTYARNHQRKLHDVAHEIVNGTLRI